MFILAAVVNIFFDSDMAGSSRCLLSQPRKVSVCCLQMHQLSSLCKQNCSNLIKWEICWLSNKKKRNSSREHKGRFILAGLSKGEVQLRHTLTCDRRDVTSHHGHAFSTWVLSPGVKILSSWARIHPP